MNTTPTQEKQYDEYMDAISQYKSAIRCLTNLRHKRRKLYMDILSQLNNTAETYSSDDSSTSPFINSSSDDEIV